MVNVEDLKHVKMILNCTYRITFNNTVAIIWSLYVNIYNILKRKPFSLIIVTEHKTIQSRSLLYEIIMENMRYISDLQGETKARPTMAGCIADVGLDLSGDS